MERKDIFFNSKMLLDEIKKTSAIDVLCKLKYSFKTDDGWNEELKYQAMSIYIATCTIILTPCAIAGDESIITDLTKAVDDRKWMLNVMYPAISEILDKGKEN